MFYLICYMTMNKIFIISGPSGVGKTTITKGVLKIFPELKTTVTFSTRTKRLGKKEDKTIKHITQEEFRKKIDAGDFIEWAMVHENLYGTDKKTLEKTLEKNNVIMNIDAQGALQIKEKKPKQTVLIFLTAKSIDELTQRVKNRGKIPEQNLKIRMANAKKELSEAQKYDHRIMNETGKIRQTINEVAHIIHSHLTQH